MQKIFTHNKQMMVFYFILIMFHFEELFQKTRINLFVLEYRKYEWFRVQFGKYFNF